MHLKQIISCLAAGLLFTGVSYAAEEKATVEKSPSEFTEAFKNGKPTLAFRLRHENSSQQGLEDGRATTLRSTVGYETAEFSRSQIKIELVDVANFFGQRFNPGVSDLTKPNYTMIRDPRGAGITEGKLIYKGFEQNTFTFGRQYIQLNNERFIGKNDFRQFPQSFDAVSANIDMISSLNLFYAYIGHVNTNNANGRSYAARRSVSTHLFNGEWDGFKYGTFIGYLYFNKDRTIKTNSHNVIGVRAIIEPESEQMGDFSYTVEFAQQQGKFGNPNKYTAYYTHLHVDKTFEPFKGTIGIERLGGNSGGNNMSFITPMGSVDNFNGLAQVFSTTPARGLQDAYGRISGSNPAADITLALTYHFFRLDKGPGAKRAGQEFDITAIFALNDQIDLSMAFAKYNPKNNVALKTRRFWVMLTANLL